MTRVEEKARVVVLISGSGSNLQSLIDASRERGSPYLIDHVISNRPGAGGLERAHKAGIAHTTLDHKDFPDRASFETALGTCINARSPDIVVCAGFMRVLTEPFVSHYQGRMINIHPSLLPSFRGLNTHARALDAGVAFAGCSVHWVSVGVDEGAIIGQAIVPVLPGDTPESLAQRVLEQEHRLYPACLNLVASGRVMLREGRTFLDGKPSTLGLWPIGVTEGG